MTAPLVPAEVDIQDFSYMPLDVRRLRDSDLSALESPEACWAAVLLWSASWHQVPAASLPDDDRVLSNLAGYGRVVTEWQRVRDGALRGWIKCDDGRLYHPVIAEKALDAWNSKLLHSYGKLKERLRKAHGKDASFPTLEEWKGAGTPPDWPQPSAGKSNSSAGIPPETPNPSAGIPPENALKGEGKGKGEERENISTPPNPPASPGGKRDGVGKKSFATWLDELRASGEKAISEYTPVWEYAERAKLPRDFVELAWVRFKEHHTIDGRGKRKLQADWRQTFRNYVENNYLRLWFWSERDQAFALSTVGIQADLSSGEPA